MTGLLVFAAAAIWSMPTLLPNSFTAATAASISSSRRAARCSVQREARPSTRVASRAAFATVRPVRSARRSGSATASRAPEVTRDTGFFTRHKVADTVVHVNTRRAAVVGGNRIPFARSNAQYARASNQDMLTAAIDGLVARYGLQDQRLGEVAAGAVLKHSRDFNLTRESVLGSRLSPSTPAYDVQQACGTGLETVILVANKIALGQVESGIGAGVDTTSDAPIAVNEDLREVLLDVNRAKSVGQRLKALAGLRPGQLVPSIPVNSEPRTGMSMGEHQAITTYEWGITREAQDELAAASHQPLAAAYDRGFFDDLITPFLGLTRDQNLRADSSVEKLAKLAPAFGRQL